MRILIIGAGAISEQFHIPASIELLGVENVFVAEKNQTQREKMQTKFSLTHVYENYEEVLSLVDSTLVATPPHIHVEIIKKCIDANLPVLCEKPLALSLKDCQEIENYNKEKQCIIALCHTYRFFPNRQKIKELISENYFGENLCIDILEGDPIDWPVVSGYNFRKELVPGGVLIDGGIHSLDFILWCLGNPTEIDYEDDSLGGLESNAKIKLKFINGEKARFRISRTCSLSNEIKITGDKNSIQFSIFEMIELSGKELENINKIYDWTTIAKYQIQDLMDAIKDKRKPLCSNLEGTKVIEIIEKCYQLKRNRPLPLKAPIPGLTF